MTFTLIRNIDNIILNMYTKFEFIWQTVHDLQPDQNFHQIMNLTLTIDPLTLTSYQILALINMYLHTKFGFSLTNSMWDIDLNVRFIRLLRTNQPTDQPTNQQNNSLRYVTVTGRI